MSDEQALRERLIRTGLVKPSAESKIDEEEAARVKERLIRDGILIPADSVPKFPVNLSRGSDGYLH